MLRLPFGTCTFVILLANVCLAGGSVGVFPSPDAPKEERLAAAIASGDLAAVKMAAEQVNVKWKDALRNNVLRHGSSEIVRYLNQHAQLGIEEVQMAVLDNDLEAVKRLVPEKAQRAPLALRNDEHSPLRLAVRRGNVPMVKLLLERKVAVNENVATLIPPSVPPRAKSSVFLDAIRLKSLPRLSSLSRRPLTKGNLSTSY
jgi:hypothetical protein